MIFSMLSIKNSVVELSEINYRPAVIVREGIPASITFPISDRGNK